MRSVFLFPKKTAGKCGACFHFIIRRSGNSENSLCGQTERQMSSSPSCAFFASTAGRRSLPANPINQHQPAISCGRLQGHSHVNSSLSLSTVVLAVTSSWSRRKLQKHHPTANGSKNQSTETGSDDVSTSTFWLKPKSAFSYPSVAHTCFPSRPSSGTFGLLKDIFWVGLHCLTCSEGQPFCAFCS